MDFLMECSHRLSQFFASRADVKLACIYGASAKGHSTPSGDIDIAVACDHVLSMNERIELANTLTLLLKREVDLVDLRNVQRVLF
jgi:predicted nucleotidyltransferase